MLGCDPPSVPDWWKMGAATNATFRKCLTFFVCFEEWPTWMSQLIWISMFFQRWHLASITWGIMLMLLNWVGGFHAGSPQKSNLSKIESNICQKKGPRGLNSSPHLLEVGEHFFLWRVPQKGFLNNYYKLAVQRPPKKHVFTNDFLVGNLNHQLGPGTITWMVLDFQGADMSIDSHRSFFLA